MTDIPADLRYTREHEWARREGDLIVVGLTAFAVKELGDIVFVDLPMEAGTAFEAEDELGTIESVKAVSTLFAPVSGTIVEKNPDLDDSPEDLNEDPYGTWMVKIKPKDAKQLDALLTADQYRKLLESAGE